MSGKPFPGPLYVLSLDPRPENPEESRKVFRLVRGHVKDLKPVLVFSTADLAREWADTNMPNNRVVQPFELRDRTEVLAFLGTLLRDGDSHVFFSSPDHTGGTVGIDDLVRTLGGDS